MTGMDRARTAHRPTPRQSRKYHCQSRNHHCQSRNHHCQSRNHHCQSRNHHCQSRNHHCQSRNHHCHHCHSAVAPTRRLSRRQRSLRVLPSRTVSSLTVSSLTPIRLTASRRRKPERRYAYPALRWPRFPTAASQQSSCRRRLRSTRRRRLSNPARQRMPAAQSRPIVRSRVASMARRHRSLRHPRRRRLPVSTVGHAKSKNLLNTTRCLHRRRLRVGERPWHRLACHCRLNVPQRRVSQQLCPAVKRLSLRPPPKPLLGRRPRRARWPRGKSNCCQLHQRGHPGRCGQRVRRRRASRKSAAQADVRSAQLRSPRSRCPEIQLLTRRPRTWLR